MVSNTDNNNQSVEKKSELPEGRYRLIGWDIDTTGRRLIDEMCQIALYTPNSQFAQYIMPYGDLNVFAQKRHCIRVVTLSRYRMLKDLKTNKFIKTKSEISALNDFVKWLEENRDESNDGVILVYHEVRKMAPAMLLEALHRYNLHDRFSAVVKGFCNSFTLAENKCAKTMKSFSLKVLSRVLLDKDEDLNNAADRARLSYHIVQHLGQGERQDLDTEGSGDTGENEKYAAELVKQYARSIAGEEQDLTDLKTFLERQNTFRPVFKDMMSFDWMSRQYASRLRRRLVENNLNFTQIQAAWEAGGKQSIEDVLKAIESLNEKEHEELLEILDCYFDPEKNPVQPKSRPHRNSTRSQKYNNNNKENEDKGKASGSDTSTSPQSEETSPRSEEKVPIEVQ